MRKVYGLSCAWHSDGTQLKGSQTYMYNSKEVDVLSPDSVAFCGVMHSVVPYVGYIPTLNTAGPMSRHRWQNYPPTPSF
jgi:hypothetical protein